MMRTFYLLLALSFFAGTQAQDSSAIGIGHKHHLFSAVLNEQREYWVYLPQSYGGSKYRPARYPVLYVLDGDNNFLSAVAIQQYLSKGLYAMIPEMMVVGVLNTDRTRDMTPTHAPQTRPGKKGLLYQSSGGGEAFASFLAKELKPAIDSAYRTSGYTVLCGHSFGGLAAINLLLKHTKLFNAYIAADPSLWWDRERLLTESGPILRTKDFTGTALYTALAYKYVSAADTTTDHPRAIRHFAEKVVPANRKNGLLFGWKYYESDDHGMVTLPALYDGLKFIFKGNQTQIKEAALQPAMVAKNYAAVSRRLGFSFQPSKGFLDALGQYAFSQDSLQSALYFFEYNQRLYPQSANVYLSLSAAYDRLGHSEKKAASLQTYQHLRQSAE